MFSAFQWLREPTDYPAPPRVAMIGCGSRGDSPRGARRSQRRPRVCGGLVRYAADNLTRGGLTDNARYCASKTCELGTSQIRSTMRPGQEAECFELARSTREFGLRRRVTEPAAELASRVTTPGRGGHHRRRWSDDVVAGFDVAFRAAAACSDARLVAELIEVARRILPNSPGEAIRRVLDGAGRGSTGPPLRRAGPHGRAVVGAERALVVDTRGDQVQGPNWQPRWPRCWP